MVFSYDVGTYVLRASETRSRAAFLFSLRYFVFLRFLNTGLSTVSMMQKAPPRSQIWLLRPKRSGQKPFPNTLLRGPGALVVWMPPILDPRGDVVLVTSFTWRTLFASKSLSALLSFLIHLPLSLLPPSFLFSIHLRTVLTAAGVGGPTTNLAGFRSASTPIPKKTPNTFWSS